MDAKETLRKFLEILPVVAQIIPADGRLGSIEQLVVTAEGEIARRMHAGEQTRDEVLQDARGAWDEDLRKAAALALLGHEGESTGGGAAK